MSGFEAPDLPASDPSFCSVLNWPGQTPCPCYEAAKIEGGAFGSDQVKRQKQVPPTCLPMSDSRSRVPNALSAWDDCLLFGYGTSERTKQVPRLSLTHAGDSRSRGPKRAPPGMTACYLGMAQVKDKLCPLDSAYP